MDYELAEYSVEKLAAMMVGMMAFSMVGQLECIAGEQMAVRSVD
jgi:hypothetical protein